MVDITISRFWTKFTGKVKFTSDQLNESNRLLRVFAKQTDVFYAIQISYRGELYLKFGIVHIRPFEQRYKEHLAEFAEDRDWRDICISHAMQCTEPAKVESEFKKSLFFKVNRYPVLPKSNGIGFHSEVIKLTKSVTASDIIKKLVDVAGSRII